MPTHKNTYGSSKTKNLRKTLSQFADGIALIGIVGGFGTFLALWFFLLKI